MTPVLEKNYLSPFFIYCVSACFALGVWWVSRDFYTDDAFISLRYSANLLQGNGLTWNPGEYVEGYTNFLFILLTAALGWLGIDLVLASRIVGFAGYAGILLALRCYLRRTPPKRYAERVLHATTLSMAAMSVPLLGWCLGGLETTLYGALITAAVCLLLTSLRAPQRYPSAAAMGIFFALAALTRPEGAIFFAYAMGFLLLCWLYPPTRARAPFRHTALIAVSFLCVFVPYMLWRHSYYGDWAPNTYYAKLWGIDRRLVLSQGLVYMLQYIYLPPLLPVVIAALGVLALRLKAMDAPLLFLAGWIALSFAYVLRAGGDHMMYFRFMAPVVPIAALFIYHSGLAIIVRKESWFRDLSGALLFFNLLQCGYVVPGLGYSPAALHGLAVENYIAAHWPKGATIALNMAGALPYAQPEYRYIDMLGLVDRHIAKRVIGEKEYPLLRKLFIGHFKGDGAYVLSRRPDYIIPSLGTGSEPDFLGDQEMRSHPDLSRYYKKMAVYVDVPAALEPQLRAEQEEAGGMGRLEMRGPGPNARPQLVFYYYEKIR